MQKCLKLMSGLVIFSTIFSSTISLAETSRIEELPVVELTTKMIDSFAKVWREEAGPKERLKIRETIMKAFDRAQLSGDQQSIEDAAIALMKVVYTPGDKDVVNNLLKVITIESPFELRMQVIRAFNELSAEKKFGKPMNIVMGEIDPELNERIYEISQSVLLESISKRVLSSQRFRALDIIAILETLRTNISSTETHLKAMAHLTVLQILESGQYELIDKRTLERASDLEGGPVSKKIRLLAQKVPKRSPQYLVMKAAEEDIKDLNLKMEQELLPMLDEGLEFELSQLLTLKADFMSNEFLKNLVRGLEIAVEKNVDLKPYLKNIDRVAFVVKKRGLLDLDQRLLKITFNEQTVCSSVLN